MKENLTKVVTFLLKFVKKIPPTVRWLFRLKIYFPVVIIALLVTFYLGVNSDQNRLGNSKVEKSPLTFFQSFEDIKITATEAQLASNIKVSQKGAPAPAGKKYLVLFTTVENASSSAKTLNYGDYFRLVADDKKLAPLPVNINFVVPAKATLEKQLIFIVDVSKKAFGLLIGPIDKEPQAVNISF